MGEIGKEKTVKKRSKMRKNAQKCAKIHVFLVKIHKN